MTLIRKKHVYDRGPRKGLVEERHPHKHSDGMYRLFSPKGVMGEDGKRHWNRLPNSRSVATLEEAADLVEQGWGIRMVGPHTTSPSLCWKDIEVVR